MKRFSYALVASFATLTVAQTAAHAEEYQGVLQFRSAAARTEVQAQAVDAAHAPNPYAEAASSVAIGVPTSSRDREAVRAEAVARAHQPNQNLRVEAFADSRIPAYYDVEARGSRQAEADSQTRVR